MFESELQAIRRGVQRDAPFGSEQWSLQIARPLVLESALRETGTRG